MIVIVGVGALGSHAALFLRNEGHPLTLVDFDRIEHKNCLSQLHPIGGVGKNKATALGAFLRGSFATKVDVSSAKLVDSNINAIIGKAAALVIDCTDNQAARRLINKYSLDERIPCLHAGISADGGFARLTWAENFAVDAEGAETGATCEDGENLPMHGLVGAQIAIVAKEFLNKQKKLEFFITHHRVERLR